MSLKQLKVFIHELELGMFVSALDKPWAETPFPTQGFVMKTSADISRVKAYCDYVYVDIEKGVSPLDIETNLGSSNRSVKSDTLLSRTQTDGTPASINASPPQQNLVLKKPSYQSKHL